MDRTGREINSNRFIALMVCAIVHLCCGPVRLLAAAGTELFTATVSCTSVWCHSTLATQHADGIC